MILAYVLGYRRAAQQAAAWVPDTSAARAYVLLDNKRLADLADELGSDLTTRYLHLRRLLLDDRHEGAQDFASQRMAEVRSAMPVVQANVMWGDFQTTRAWASASWPSP